MQFNSIAHNFRQLVTVALNDLLKQILIVFLEPLMLKQRFGIYSFERVLIKALMEKVFKFFRDRLWQRWHIFLHNFNHCRAWMQVTVRWVCGQQFNDCAAQTPNITSWGDLPTHFYDFWRHPIRSAHCWVALFGVGKLSSHTEICQFDDAILRS